MYRGEVLGIIAAKGGVGKTTVALNIGAAMCQMFNKRVLVVDANFSTPHLGLSIGLVNPYFTLQDVITGKISVFQALYKHGLGFYVLPGALAPKKVNPLFLKSKIDELREYFDKIIIDSSPSLNDEMLATMQASDSLLVVTSSDHLTLSSTMHAVAIAKKKNIPIAGLIINRAKGKKFEISQEEIEKATNVPVLASFIDDNKVLEALSAATPVVLYAPQRKISYDYEKLAALLLGQEYKRQSIIEKFANILKNSFNFRQIFAKEDSSLKGGS